MSNHDSEKNTKYWTYEEGKALISVYERRKDEYFQCTRKNIFWESILNDLESLNVLESPTTVEQVAIKWRCLYRTYKQAKQRGGVRYPKKFKYMEQMNSVFKNSPTLHTNNISTVGIEINPDPASDASVNSNESQTEVSLDACGDCGKKTTTDSLLELKKKYYADKMREKHKMRMMLLKLFRDKEESRAKRHLELISLLNKLNS